jgi:hypothetical protein
MTNVDLLSTAALYLRGDHLDPDLVTEVLGTMPTIGRRKGEPIMPEEGVEQNDVQPTGLWCLASEERPSASDCIAELSSLLSNRSADIDAIDGVDDYFVDILVHVSRADQNDEHYSVGLSKDDVASLHALKAPFQCKVGFVHNATTDASVSEASGGHCCSAMAYAVEREDMPLDYWHVFREFGIRVLDGGTTSLCIEHCPWCSTKLPRSIRRPWYAELERRGVNPDIDELPDDFKDDTWHQG